MRKLFAAFALLVITGVLPTMANAGMCAARPCCRSHQAAPTSTVSHQDCCSETNCSTAPAHELAPSEFTRNAHLQPLHVGVVAKQVIAHFRPLLVPERISIHPGSPPTRERLASLSILLI
jgi:hypothetical protein